MEIKTTRVSLDLRPGTVEELAFIATVCSPLTRGDVVDLLVEIFGKQFRRYCLNCHEMSVKVRDAGLSND